ncbi:MAG: hypothetical protein JW782_01390 [Candidatus Saganbacteria bacterium]|nr:hypothetical protein [Candidatus Saganbacteria bacterium]
MKICSVILRPVRSFSRLVRPRRIDLRQPIPPNLRIGPLQYDQWDELLHEINPRSHLFASYQLDTLDKILAFTQEKARAMGMGQPIRDWQKWSDWRPHVEPWHTSVLMEILTMVFREAATKFNLPMDDALLRAGSAFLYLRVLKAKNNVGDDLSTPEAQAELAEVNQLLQEFGRPAKVVVGR